LLPQDEDFIAFIINNGTSLHVINVTSTMEWSYEMISIIANHCTSLRKFQFIGSVEQDPIGELELKNVIEDITLNCYEEWDDIILKLVSNNIHLNGISFNHSNWIRSPTLTKLLTLPGNLHSPLSTRRTSAADEKA
jgi:hypothetical protein